MLSQEAHEKEIKEILDSIDVINQSNSNSEQQNQHVMASADAFALHDQWLQYTYLQPATAIEDFTLEGIQRARAEQVRKTSDSLTKMQQFRSCTTDEIEVPVEIPVSELRDGGTHLFRIWNDFRDFMPYTDARIQSVVARVDGIERTDSGQYDLRIGYTGRPFFNKGLDGTFLAFHTEPRERTYSYKVEGNQPLFDDGGQSWSEGVTMVTPYSIWEISLPQTSNAGLRFQSGSTVMVVLTFKLQARIKEEALQAAAPTPTEEEKALAKSMGGNSKLHNWDVVFNMLLNNINEVLRQQYEEMQWKLGYGGKIEATTQVKTGTIKGYTINQYAVRVFDLTYGYPSLNFLVNSANKAKLSFTISGSIQSGTKWIGDVSERNENKLKQLAAAHEIPESDLTKEVIDGEEKLVLGSLEDPQPINNEQLTAIIELSTVTGVVNNDKNIMSVVLDMAKGTFDAERIETKLTGEEQVELNKAIKTYFATNPVYFIINSLDLKRVPTLDDLKPNQFLFKVLKTRNNPQILQLFIHTNKREVTEDDRNYMYIDAVEEPIPAGHQTSLIISNRIMFNNVLPAIIHEPWKVAGAGEAEKRHSEFAEAKVIGKVDKPIVKNKVNIPFGQQIYEYESTEGLYGTEVSCNLAGMCISSQDTSAAKLSHQKEHIFYFMETITTSLIGKTPTAEVNDVYTRVTLKITGNLPFVLSGWGRSQKLEFNFKDTTFAIEGHTSGGGFFGCDDFQAQINKKLKEQLPDQLKQKLAIGFSGFSVFAIQNLLFPCGNSIKLTTVHLPSDLILLGKFN